MRSLEELVSKGTVTELTRAETILPSITQETLFDLLNELERLRAELRFLRNH